MHGSPFHEGDARVSRARHGQRHRNDFLVLRVMMCLWRTPGCVQLILPPVPRWLAGSWVRGAGAADLVIAGPDPASR